MNKHLQAKGEEPPTNVKWRQVVEKKAYRGRMWKMMEKKTFPAWDVPVNDQRQRSIDSWPNEEKQTEIQGQWQQESPAREYLEQVKCCHDTDCNESMMKKGFTALKNGTWEEYKETFKEKMRASEWAFDMMGGERSTW